jgi:hypothetical protein
MGTQFPQLLGIHAIVSVGCDVAHQRLDKLCPFGAGEFLLTADLMQDGIDLFYVPQLRVWGVEVDHQLHLIESGHSGLVLIVTAPLIAGEFLLQHFKEGAVIPGLPKLRLTLCDFIAGVQLHREHALASFGHEDLSRSLVTGSAQRLEI